ncbi:MAG: hypothetical protein QOC98_67, partial [Frankiaceae bacterium]|nr:hypothetical protein [Frankiaceae bacterium]
RCSSRYWPRVSDGRPCPSRAGLSPGNRSPSSGRRSALQGLGPGSTGSRSARQVMPPASTSRPFKSATPAVYLGRVPAVRTVHRPPPRRVASFATSSSVRSDVRRSGGGWPTTNAATAVADGRATWTSSRPREPPLCLWGSPRTSGRCGGTAGVASRPRRCGRRPAPYGGGCSRPGRAASCPRSRCRTPGPGRP